MIKPNTLVAPFDYVSQFDDAVDKDVPDFEHKWKVYRDGMGQPPLKAGETPTTFNLRHITSTERLYLLELANGDDKGLYIAAAAMALIGVKGLQDAEGRPVLIVQEVTHVGPVRIRSATKASLDHLPLEVLLEIGALVMERASARPSS